MVPNGDYKVLNSAYFGKATHLLLMPGARILSQGAGFSDTILFGAWSAVNDVTVEGGQFVNTVATLTGIRFTGGERLSVIGSRFSGFTNIGGCIYALAVTDLLVERCKFASSSIGAGVYGNSRDARILKNRFSQLSNNGVRVSGSGGAFSIGVDISNNDFQPSAGNQSPIYVTCVASVMHKHVRIANNEVIGKGVPFADGGNADLISTFGIDTLTITGNTTSGAGDLNIAIEKVRNGTITGNTGVGGDQHGITVHDSDNVTVSGNALSGIGKDVGNINDRAYVPLCGIQIYGNCSIVNVSGNTISNADGGLADYAVGVNKLTGTLANLFIGVNAHAGMTVGELFVKSGESVKRLVPTTYP